MSSCNKCRKMMAGALYGDLSARRQKLLDTHLASCPACAKEYRQLTLTLKVMDQREIPEVPPTYWPSFWARLSDKIEQAGKRAQQPAWWRWLPSELPIRPALVPIAAALLLVATGIYIGRSIYLDHSPTGLPVASKAAVLDPVAIQNTTTWPEAISSGRMLSCWDWTTSIPSTMIPPPLTFISYKQCPRSCCTRGVSCATIRQHLQSEPAITDRPKRTHPAHAGEQR